MRYDSSEHPTALDRYRSSLHAVVPLSADVERELAFAWREGDAAAGNRLMEASLPFVIRVAKEYRRWGIPLEDLVQQGNIGLLRAAKKYDPDKNCRLITYAVYWIRAEIRDYVVRGYRIVRLGTTRTERAAMRTFRRSGVETAAELADLSGMPASRCEKLWPLLTQADMSLDYSYGDRPPAGDRLPSMGLSPEEHAIQRAESTSVRAALTLAMDLLTDRERKIVEARMLSDMPQTLEALGRELGVSKERVRQLEERARAKLRSALAEYHPQAA